MRTPLSLAPALLICWACYPEDRYQEDIASARCDFYERCELLEDPFGYESLDDCLNEWAQKVIEDQEEGYLCQDYDPKMARDCVEGIELLSCEDVAEGYPSSCSSICSED